MLIAHSYRDAGTCAAVAHALLALAHATATFHVLGFDPDHATKARRAADVLVASLADRR